MRQRLLVTGGAGFIGSHIVDAARRSGWDVAALDDLSSGQAANLPDDVPLYRVDVRDAGLVEQAFLDFRPTAVSHQAAQASVSVSVRDPVLDADINIMGGLNVLNACVATQVQRLIFASTGGAIYGEVAEPGAAHEQAPLRPYSPYATSKLAFETYLETYRRQYGLQSTVLRYANVYGPRQNPHGEAGVVAIFATRLAQNEPLTINARQAAGDDGCVRDYVYVADVAQANIAAVLGQTPALMNIGTGTGVTTRVLAAQLARALGVTPDLQSGPPRAGDLERSVLDPSTCTSVLGHLTPLDQGLQLTATWFAERLQPS